MKRVVTDAQWEEAKNWLIAGMKMKDVAAKLGVSQGRASQKLGKKRPKLVPTEPALAT